MDVDDDDDDDDSDMEDAPELPDDNVILANKRAHLLFARLFRSKGEFWLATRPNRAGEWSQAGAMLTMVGGRPWFIVTDRAEWDTGNTQINAMVESDLLAGGEYGDRRQEIVFIGEDLDIPQLKRVFDECLLTDEEWEQWKAVMSTGEGPNRGSEEEIRGKEEQLAELFEDGFPEWISTGGHDHEHDHDHDHDHAHPHPHVHQTQSKKSH